MIVKNNEIIMIILIEKNGCNDEKEIKMVIMHLKNYSKKNKRQVYNANHKNKGCYNIKYGMQNKCKIFLFLKKS